MVLAGSGFVCLPLLYGRALDGSARREAAALCALSLLLLSGGVGYAREKEWGRRVVDVALWGFILLLAGYLGRLVRGQDYRAFVMPAVCLYVAVAYRCEVWQPDVLKVFGRDAGWSCRAGRRLLLRMVGVIAAVGVAAWAGSSYGW